jgi:WD40 repeat protein
VVPAKDQRDALLIGPPTEIVSGFRSPYAHGAAFSADFQTFAIGSGRNSTLLVHRGHPDQRLTLGPQNDPRYIAISPDGQWVATGSHHSDGVSKSVFIWDAKTGNRVHELPLVGSTGVRFSPNGKWLVTNNHMGSDLWEVRTWLRAHHFDHYVQTAFTPDSRLLARGDILGAIRLCETETGREVARLAGPKPGWYQVECFTPDGTKLLAGFDGRIYVFDLRAIRQGLVALGLDWDWPPFLPTADSETLPTPLRAKFTAQPGGSDVGRNDP